MEKPLAAAIPTWGIVIAWQMRINQAVMDSVKRILAKHAFRLAGMSLQVFLHVKAQLVLVFEERSKLV